MSGSPGSGLKSNRIGRDAGAAADTLDVSVGTSQNRPGPVYGSVSPLVGVSPASWMLADVFSRASTKKSSGAAPLLVIDTGTVTGVPAASVVLALSGRPDALTCTLLNLMLPVNGCESSVPATGSATSTASVQVPGTGLSV